VLQEGAEKAKKEQGYMQLLVSPRAENATRYETSSWRDRFVVYSSWFHSFSIFLKQ